MESTITDGELNTNKRTITVDDMLDKLNSMYDREDNIKKQIRKLQEEYRELQQDKELLQMMIMRQTNKERNRI